MPLPALMPAADSSLAQPLQADVSRKARVGAGWLLLDLIGKQLIALAATSVLARMLSAGDYGLLGMAATFTALIQVFNDLGLSWATIQRREITRAQVAALFAINAAAGGLPWLISVALATFGYRRGDRPGADAAGGANRFGATDLEGTWPCLTRITRRLTADA